MSSRNEYRVDALRKKVDERYTRQMDKILTAYEMVVDIDTRTAAWRAGATYEVLNLADRLRGKDGAVVTDAELSGFRVREMPRVDYAYARPENKRDRDLASLAEWHQRAIDRLDTLKPDGTLILTPTMLNDLLGL